MIAIVNYGQNYTSNLNDQTNKNKHLLESLNDYLDSQGGYFYNSYDFVVEGFSVQPRGILFARKAFKYCERNLLAI